MHVEYEAWRRIRGLAPILKRTALTGYQLQAVHMASKRLQLTTPEHAFGRTK